MSKKASPLARFRVVVLPDFFLDAIVTLPSWTKAEPAMKRIVDKGGGNLPVGPIDFKVGGNAANLALALARLGAQVELITETNPVGHAFLERAARESGLGLQHVRVGRETSATLALEFPGANLMLSHAGPLYDFGPSRLSAAAWKAMESADAVLVNNWAQNHAGTRLLGAVVPRLRRKGVFVYLDTADPRHRGPDFPRLLRERRIFESIDAWGLNENEVRAAMNDRAGHIEDLAARLSERLGCRLDLHTRGWAATVRGKETTRVDAFRSQPRRLTGAGDAWNAGNVAGYLLGLPGRRRLHLAHAVATRYVTATDPLPPSHRDLPSRMFEGGRSAT